jgi:hypothetical protein
MECTPHPSYYRCSYQPGTSDVVIVPQGTLSPRPGSHLVHAGVAARANERRKLERLCRYSSRPAVSEKRLSLTPNENVRYDVKGFTSVAGAWMRRSDPAEDPLPRRHHARHLRAAGFHRPVGRLGAQAPGQPDTFPWGIRAQQPVPGAGDEGLAGQGRPASLDRGSGGDHTGRTPGLDDLGAASETGVHQK